MVAAVAKTFSGMIRPRIPPAMHLDRGYCLWDAITGDLRGESPGQEPGEEEPGWDGQEDPCMALPRWQRG